MSWPLIRLGDLVSVKGGKRLPKGESYSDEITTHPYIRVTDFKNNSVDMDNLVYISDDIHEKISRYIISHDDLYISIAGTIGLVGVIPKELSGANLTENAAKLVIHDHKQLCKEYLNWYLSTAGQVQIQSKKKATSQPKLALFRIEEIEIPLPPLAEQKRIAAILDKADTIRQKRKQAIDLADEFLRSVFLDMFGDPVTNPKGWKVSPMKKLIDIQGGYAFKSGDFGETGTPVVKIGNANKLGFTTKGIAFIEPDNPEKLKQYELYAGDLLMSLTGTVGKDDYANITEVTNAYSKYYLNQRVAKISILSPVMKSYLKYYFANPKVKSEITKNNRGVRQANISNNDIYDLDVPVPDEDSLRKFAVLATRMQDLRHKIKLQPKSDSELFNALSQKAFSGEL
ncbi:MULTISPECIES: restriction endonuclease subunit S [unclassified Vibrio]|uniref:restriction endonuclease subunit S n=1 Tax=unclassified Vibrio TaxID=2614977 RepID=UPI00354C1024